MPCSRRCVSAALLFLPLLAAHPAAAQDRPSRVVDFGIGDGKVFGPGIAGDAKGGPTFRVRLGERVELRWTSDRQVVVHIHGSGSEVTVPASRPTSTVFHAKAAGRFPVETHGAFGRRETLLYIEVAPR